MLDMPTNRLSRHRRLLGHLDDDPMNGVANLFDVAMVFAVALLLSLLTHMQARDSRAPQTSAQQEGKASREQIEETTRSLQNYRVSQEALSGQGERLGVAYRLENGDVVYVPE